MTDTPGEGRREPKRPRSTGQLFFEAVERFDEGVALRRRDAAQHEWVDYTWREFGEHVESLGAALMELGVSRGDRVAILSNSRVEWVMVDQASFAIGATTVPIYQSNLPDEVRYILEHAGAKVVFVEDREQLGKVLEVKGELPALEHAILIEGKVKTPGFVLGYPDIVEQGEAALAASPQMIRERLATVTPDDVATIVYTSGTTGRPKGAVLTHSALTFEIRAVGQVLPVDERDETLLFLPLAHIFARVGYLGALDRGYTISFAESIDRMLDNVGEVRPTFLFSVPRIYEKVYDAVVGGVRRGGRMKKQIFAFAMAIGERVSRRRQQGKRVPPHLALSFQVAELLVFKKLADRFGGKLRFFISGGAPLSREIAEFFHAAGMLVLEGYGLTENVAAASLNTLDAYRFGTVGKPLPGVDVKIAEDGEILIGGPNILREYYQRPDASAEAIVDGWFHTGDIGEFDADGFLRITDRKKDLIVTSAGKNIAPQKIENIMKTAPMVSQIMVYGDKRNYLTAIITLDEEETRRYAEHKEIEFDDFRELVAHPAIRERAERQIQERNADLASYETIKKIAIAAQEFELGEELTPTLKVKRKVVIEKYWDLLDGLYQAKS